MTTISIIPTDKTFIINGKIELFPQQGGWHYVKAPEDITNQLNQFADRGLIAITATLGKTQWQTSLLPFGDDTHFIALSKKVRQSERVSLGDKIKITFSLRER